MAIRGNGAVGHRHRHSDTLHTPIGPIGQTGGGGRGRTTHRVPVEKGERVALSHGTPANWVRNACVTVWVEGTACGIWERTLCAPAYE
jgi:hypothetical protein